MILVDRDSVHLYLGLVFFKCGLMRACLRSDGKCPCVSDLFTIAVIIGSTSSTHCFNNFVGMGSSMHDEFLLVIINNLISFEVVIWRIVNLVSVSGCLYMSE